MTTVASGRAIAWEAKPRCLLDRDLHGSDRLSLVYPGSPLGFAGL
ncbi:MAG: hypothetical protein WBA43_14085 [Elainellaceae cyanobacterium]